MMVYLKVKFQPKASLHFSVFAVLGFDFYLPQSLTEIRLQLAEPETQKGCDFFFQKSQFIATGSILLSKSTYYIN